MRDPILKYKYDIIFENGRKLYLVPNDDGFVFPLTFRQAKQLEIYENFKK